MRAQRSTLADVQKLRVEHHICGVLSGTLPQVGQQNVFLGLPLMLLPEEIVLLVKNSRLLARRSLKLRLTRLALFADIAVLVDDCAAHRKATKEQADAYMVHREAAILAQQTESRRFDDDKRAKMAEVHKEKIERARLAREKALEAKKKAAEEAGTTFEVKVPDLKAGKGETTGPPPSTVAEAPSQPPLSSIPYTIIIQPSSLDMPWYDPSSASYDTLEAAREAGLYNYPDTPVQAARCKVFEDLWRKGHYMGGGLRFGGDFLVYPGELSRLPFASAPKLTLSPSQATLSATTRTSPSPSSPRPSRPSCPSILSPTVVSPRPSRRLISSQAGTTRPRKQSTFPSSGLLSDRGSCQLVKCNWKTSLCCIAELHDTIKGEACLLLGSCFCSATRVSNHPCSSSRRPT